MKLLILAIVIFNTGCWIDLGCGGKPAPAVFNTPPPSKCNHYELIPPVKGK